MSHRPSSQKPDYRVLYLAQDGRCFYCHVPMVPQSRKHRAKTGWTRDHFWPRSQGNNLLENVVLACRRCNTGEKGDRDPTETEQRRFERLMVRYRQILESAR